MVFWLNKKNSSCLITLKKYIYIEQTIKRINSRCRIQPSFDSFFNNLQFNTIVDYPNSYFKEKLDGSLIKLYFFEGRRMGPSSQQSKYITLTLKAFGISNLNELTKIVQILLTYLN